MATDQNNEIALVLTTEERALIIEALRHLEMYYRDMASTYAAQGLDQEMAVGHRRGDDLVVLTKRLREAFN